MPEPIQQFVLWEEPRPTLETVLGLSPDQLSAVAAFIDREGFGIVDELSLTLPLARQLGITHERVVDLLRYLELLDAQRKQFELSPEQVIQEFKTYILRKNLPLLDKLALLQEPLLRIFHPRPELELRAKARTVSRGLIPSADSFESLCDLRPVFNEGRDTILDYVPVAIMRIHAETESDFEELIFQIDSEKLEELEKFVKQTRQKFDAIESLRQKLMSSESK